MPQNTQEQEIVQTGTDEAGAAIVAVNIVSTDTKYEGTVAYYQELKISLLEKKDREIAAIDADIVSRQERRAAVAAALNAEIETIQQIINQYS